MTEHDDDGGVARRYRDLAREEPPAALDAAILAASRKGARRGIGRWAGPVSIAAVLVLGVGVSLRMQTEQPGVEAPLPAAPNEYALPPAAEPEAAPAPARKAAAPRPAPTTPAATAPAPAAAPPPPQPLSDAAAPRRKREAFAGEAATPEPPAAAARAERKATTAASDPASELERIARLREAGRDAEADAALADFRRRHPDYRIPEAMQQRVRAR